MQKVLPKVVRLAALAAAGFIVTACNPIYTLDIQQGNLFSKNLVDSLKPGMTKHQVTLVMGSPSIVIALGGRPSGASQLTG